MKIVVISDTHTNSTVGLWPPDFIRDDGGLVPQNKFQKWLWKHWLDFNKQVDSTGEYIVVHNGDAIQGIHPSRDIQIVVPGQIDMLKAAEQVLAPLFKNAKERYMIRGTEWHDGLAGSDCEMLGKLLNAYVNPDLGQFSQWTMEMVLGGKRFAFAHHTSNTTVYHATPPAREWREAKEAYADWAVPIPDVIVRSHVHRWGCYPDEMGRLYFTMPAWQLKNAFSYKHQPRRLPSIGGLILWVEKGEVRWQKHLYPIPMEQPILISN